MFLSPLKQLPLILFVMLWGPQLCLANVLAADKPLDASQVLHSPVSLTEYVAVLEDPSTTLTLAEVQKPAAANRFNAGQPAAEALGYGLTASAYWLRLTLQNSGKLAIERMLEISEAGLSDVRFYQPDAHGVYQAIVTGMAMPFATRPYKNHNFVFPVALPPQSDQTIYIRVESKAPTIIPARLWAPQAFHAHERDDYLVQAWYFGMVSAMLLFNLLLFISLRDVIYLLYVGSCLCVALSIAALNGLFKEFIVPDSSFWLDNSVITMGNLSFSAFFIFMRQMLNTRLVAPMPDRLIKLAIGFYLIFLWVGHEVPLQAIYKLTLPINVFSIALIIWTCLFCVYKRQRSAYFFLVAFFVFILGLLATILRGMGVLPTTTITIYSVQVGSVLEMLLLAFALADRFNRMRKDKEMAQLALLENMKESELDLQLRVMERTLELQRANKKLEALSTTDGLTGIANRRHFDDVLASEWLRAERSGLPVALALCDVDWFKKYNDRYGHQMGDECLKKVAKVLADTVCREGDLVARYGGEEFAFIAPATDTVAAFKMAQDICKRFQELALPHELSDFGFVTISIGVTAIIPKPGLEPDSLIKTADEALYRAKKQGRNQVYPGGIGGTWP